MMRHFLSRSTPLIRRWCGARSLAASALLALLGSRSLGAQVQSEIRGQVIDANSSRAVAGARVEIVGRAEHARTGSDGAFVLRGMEPREYTLRVRALGYRARDVDVTVSNARTTMVTIALEAAPARLAATVVRGDAPPASVAASFDRAAIEASGRRDVGELLRDTPGLVITQSGGAGAATHVSVRGSSAREVLVLVDGVPVNSAVTGEADLSRLSLESVERVTVLTGAASSRYGGRALAGVIAVETRRPTSDASMLIRTGAWGERGASVSVGGGQTIEGHRVTGSITGDLRSLRGDFPFELPDVRGGGTERRLNSDATSRSIAGTLATDDESGAGTARLRGSWEQLSRGLAGTIVQPSLTGRESHRRASAGLDLRRDRDRWSWSAAGDVTHERSTFTDRAPPFGTPFNDTASATGFTGTVSVTAQGVSSSASAGVETRTLDVHSTMLAEGAPHWQRLLGAYASARAGHVFETLDVRIDGSVAVRLDHASTDGAVVFSPRAEVEASRGRISASASVGTGYAPPSLTDQFFHEGVLVRPNPALRPERVTADVEARVAVRDVSAGPLRLSAGAAAYSANVDGMILWLPDFRFVWSPSNFAVRRTGWELTGRATVAGGRIDIHGTLNRTDVTYTGNVLRGQVAYRPRTTASVTAAGTLPVGRLEVAHRFVGERRTVPGSALNALAPYSLTDVRWTSTVHRARWQLDASIGVDNVFDRPAAMLVDYPFPGRTWTLSLRVRRTPPTPE